ncbi:hypothetical protein BEN47_06825 [Hymenobacter lapidarius]|uniref:DUF4249 domain-containing protein n=1 Tax=Hymenobacter lapidarius TaxID=1908237 RepID=A0A1G1TFD8_9BACT|nr:DUF4249 domain-containing protein [Hymenobacter lapidarius]OGX89591.1 hypothetical protein BEN47_06825 [Hymenobacter lapidarius]
MRAPHSSVFRALRWCLALALPACTDPYMPDVVKSPPSYLVVDGFLNSKGVTTIKLSRTFAVDSKAAPPTENRATAYIEEEGGPRYLLREAPAGTYTSASLVLNPAKRHRLHLNTFAGKQYASDYVPVKTTPPIDAVSWRLNNAGLDITVDARDATNATQYYRWETDETWEIIPPYFPSVEYVNGAIRNIQVPFPRICWGNAKSTNVLLYKTTSLAQDVVSDFRVRQLIPPTPLLYSRYSILVQQFALTKEEYAYWELLRKNTESIGSLFDPQPSQLTGNVRCLSNSADLALGFVGAHSRTEKRILISRTELPRSWPVSDGYEDCVPPDTVFLNRPLPPPPPAQTLEINFNRFTGRLPINAVFERGSLAGYTAKKRECIDCRVRGTSVKPSYWP